MGNGTSCLSSALVHHHNYASAEDPEFVRVVRSTDGELFHYPGPVFAKDLMAGFHGFAVCKSLQCKKPLHPDTQLTFRQLYHLKPLLHQPSNNISQQADHDHHGKPKHMGSHKSLPEEERSTKKPKVSSSSSSEEEEEEDKADTLIMKVKEKKVRFADQVKLISSSGSSSDQEMYLRSSRDGEGQKGEELSHKTQASHVSNAVEVRASYIGGHELVLEKEEEEEEGALSHIRQQSGIKVEGVVRLKVVISRKQLTELMSPRTTEKQADALVERMIAPLLSPHHQSSTNKSQTLQDGALVISPTNWRPSLEHIPEDS